MRAQPPAVVRGGVDVDRAVAEHAVELRLEPLRGVFVEGRHPAGGSGVGACRRRHTPAWARAITFSSSIPAVRSFQPPPQPQPQLGDGLPAVVRHSELRPPCSATPPWRRPSRPRTRPRRRAGSPQTTRARAGQQRGHDHPLRHPQRRRDRARQPLPRGQDTGRLYLLAAVARPAILAGLLLTRRLGRREGAALVALYGTYPAAAILI